VSNGVDFPDPGQFFGTYVPNDNPAVYGGQSTYDGSIAVTLLDRIVVEAVLPVGFELAARRDGATTHPVVHLIGHQRNPMLLVAGELFPAPDPGYVEMILLAPYVLLPQGATTAQGASAQDAKWHTFVVRMYLNDDAAIEIGNSVFAYRKRFAYLPESDPPGVVSWDVFPHLEGDVFRSAVTQNGQWLSLCGVPAPLPAWPNIQKLFEMPLVGVDDGAVTRIVCSYWEWDYTNAEISEGTSQHDILQPFCPGMGGGWIGPRTGPSVLIRGLRWRLSQYPPQCEF
jgi:hypothetical protein